VLPGGRPVGLHADGGPSLFGWRPLGTRWTAGPTDTPTFSFGATTPVPPVAAGNTVLADTGTVLAAIDASSGTVRWTADDVHRRPAVRDGTVYALGLESLYGFDLDSGARSTVATLDNGLRSVTATPDRIVVGTYEELVAVSYDGTIGWRYSPDGETELEEVAPAAADGVVYASFSTETDRQVVAVDAADGTRLWTAPVAVSQGGGRGAMAVGDERLYVPTQDDGIAALDRADGRERWRYTWDTVGPVSPPALVDGRLYAVVAGTLYALEAP
jgi:outer membrane protein assembly factor BamB